MELIEGTVSVTSKPGVGSDFKLIFPINKIDKSMNNLLSEKESGISVDDIPKEKTRKIKPKILYVEDEKDCFDLVNILLQKKYDVEKASTGKEGIMKAEQAEYSLILLDINLGKGMTGLDAMSEIRKIPYYKDVPIIAITGFAMKGDEQEFRDAGCTDYISKPFNKNLLFEKISKALKRA